MLNGRGIERLGEKAEGIEKCKLEIQNSHRDVKCSTGNVVASIVITRCGARLLGGLLRELYEYLTTMMYT